MVISTTGCSLIPQIFNTYVQSAIPTMQFLVGIPKKTQSRYYMLRNYVIMSYALWDHLIRTWVGHSALACPKAMYMNSPCTHVGKLDQVPLLHKG